ncbi:cytochrome c oxidase accessory protein CcoG [Janthinobacterium sp. CG3]|uniref:cytochrome c oxidase accessory protein CcoG n=1 Tax=Janthinobacterium sp. CG3 TaxID=1075768 RepID=UPI0003487B17|nr:cytochrome c oxidase accessory protein CcoG [Janthinobacterium sp. CG3]
MSDPAPQVIKMYAAREEIYPREAKGRYASLRWVCVWLTQLMFYGLPWLSWNGRQALLFDLGTRKFYILGVVLWPQDFIYLAALLIICAYLLFLVTAIAGRVWCGFACPQTVYTEIFLWIERRIEGTRSARMLLDKQGPSLRKAAKKTAKHLAWGAVALWTGFTFVGYFTPIHTLAHEVATLSFGPWEWFWVLFYALATYGNAGWLREQVCKYMCPYARFQSAMFDQDTLIITYDVKRGEPRGALNKKAAPVVAAKTGDCIDCTLCVQVCPTGIDIRQGLQYECIGCAACVDACNTVMDKIDRPRGLIRYSTDHALANNFSVEQIRQRALRPRVLIYTAILAVITAAVVGSLALRTPLKLDVIRDRGAMGREVEDGMVENVYRLQIMNTAETPHRYKVKVSGLPSLALVTPDEVSVGATETLALPVRLRAAHGAGAKGSNQIAIELTALDDPSLHVMEKAVFFVPR